MAASSSPCALSIVVQMCNMRSTKAQNHMQHRMGRHTVSYTLYAACNGHVMEYPLVTLVVLPRLRWDEMRYPGAARSL